MKRRDFLKGVTLMGFNVSAARPPTGIVQARQLHAAQTSYSDGCPITLNATVDLASGVTASPNVAALKNPTPFPIEINEIRVHAQSVNPALSDAAIGIKLELPNYGPIVDAFTQPWLLDQSVQLYQGESNQVQTTGITIESEADYVWKLATPLLILPGETLVPTMQNYGLFTDDVTVDITYTGRVLTTTGIPRRRMLPYVNTWQGDSLDISIFAAAPTNATLETDSTEQDLKNGAEEPVIIRKITGRLVSLSNTTDNTSFSDEVQPIIDSMFSISLRTSHGYDITAGQFIPFRQLFGRDTRDFDCDIVLDPGEYLIAQVVADQGAYTGIDIGGTTYYPTLLTPVTPQIGMICEREVAV